MNVLAALIRERTNQSLRGRIVGVYGILIALNLAAWAWALLAFHHYPALLGTALLAYSFGLRHAVDADHIAAIDAVTRKFMQEGKRPVSVGFYFSLGHSTVVILASVAVAVAAITLAHQFGPLRVIGSLIGTSVSATFLLLIALVNMIILRNICQTFRRVKAGGKYEEVELNALLAGRGFLARLFRPLFAMIHKSWHMYPLGFLFGLGFDTASEVGLLGISAATAGRGLSVWTILIFPALFTAAMSLIDTTDGILMLGAYGWAFIKPTRKLYYNMTLTFVSVLVALAVGGIEALGLIGSHLNLGGSFWKTIDALNSNFGSIGYLIVAIFLLSWLFAAMVYRLRKYDELDIAPTEGATD